MGNVREKELAILLKAKADVDTAFSQLKGQLEGAEDVAKKTAEGASKSWEENLTKIRNVSAVAFAAVAGSIGFAVREAAAGEQGMANFRASVRNAGGDADGLSQRLNDTAMKLQRLTGIADDEYVDAAARMTDITGDAAGSIDKLGLVADLATARKIPLASAADAVARAMEGEIGALARIMPGLDEQVRALGENADKADIVAVIFDRMAQYEGRAAEAANSTTGAINILKQELAATVENGGNPFLETVKGIATDLRPVVQSVGDWASEHAELTKAIGLGALGITGFLATVTTIGTVIPPAVRGIYALRAAAIALAASPWTLVAAGIIAVGAVAWNLSDAMTATAKSEADLKKITDETGVSYQTLRQKQEEIFGKFADYKSGTDAQRAAWDTYVLSLYAALDPLDATEKKVKSGSAAHKKAAEDIRLNTDAIRELMNAGLDFEAARAMSRGAVLPTIDVEPVEPAFMGPIEDPVAIARYEFEQQKAKEASEAKLALWEQERQAFLRHTDFLQNSYGFAVNTMLNTELTGKQKRDAILEQFKAGAINKFAQVTSNFIFGELAKQAATKVTAAVGMAASNAHTTTETANSAKRTGSFMGEAYAKLVAFYSFLGPFAPAAAVGTIGVAIAGIGSIIASAMGAMKFQQGGIVPGTGFGDKVPAWLEPGEFVMNRNATRENYGALQAMNSGSGIARGGNQVSIHMNLDGQGLTLQRKIEIRDLVEEMLPTAIERALDDRRFSASYAS